MYRCVNNFRRVINASTSPAPAVVGHRKYGIYLRKYRWVRRKCVAYKYRIVWCTKLLLTRISYMAVNSCSINNSTYRVSVSITTIMYLSPKFEDTGPIVSIEIHSISLTEEITNPEARIISCLVSIFWQLSHMMPQVWLICARWGALHHVWMSMEVLRHDGVRMVEVTPPTG